ncbi:DUF421 domain-containing protein [Bacillus salipaludis]|uniref:DUF421 domain-containing protein n=1 Tax=Bacillus salipaludis TaxID=2547811 RepID=A0AA90TS93_9BACI|nr:DUF421 domain-containing protein [Bacillus salipaludis]MDQ6597345.1 DUF421 domain-containing protein [Bacillus salipaludis]
MTFFNYITGISIGAVAGSMTIDSSIKVSTGIVSLLTWTGLTVLVGIVDLKFRKFRKIVEGEPIILIKQGKVLEKALKKSSLDINQLQMLLRKKDVFSFQDVDYAIFETSGELSVMLKEAKQPLKQEQLPFQVKQQQQAPIPMQIITDGKVIEENLQQLNIDRNWVDEQLTRAGTILSEVFYAELQKDGSLYIDKRNDQFLH